jgi:hypothetical protein
MTISDFSVQNVLKVYNKQYKIGKLVKGSKKASNPKSELDVVEISHDSKKLAFIKNVSHELAVELEGEVTKEEITAKVNRQLTPFIDELASEFSPEDEDIINIIKDRLLELF